MSSAIATRPPIIAPAPRPVTRDAQRAPAPAASATRPRVVTIPGILGSRHAAERSGGDGICHRTCHPRNVSQTWGRPATETGAGWAVVDVETSGFRPGQARIVSVAALALGDDGNVEQSLSTPAQPRRRPRPHPRARPDRRNAAGPAVLRRRRRRPHRAAEGPHARRPQRRLRLLVPGRRGRTGRGGAARRHRDVHGRADPPARARHREPAAGDAGGALGHHAR